MVKNITGTNNGDGITVDATGAVRGDEVSLTVTDGVQVSGTGRVNDINMNGGDNTLIVSGANRDGSQDGVSSSGETRIGKITSGNGDNFISIRDSGSRDSIGLSTGNDTVILQGAYFRDGVNMQAGDDLVQVGEGSAPVDAFVGKSPFEINGGSGIDTLDLYGDFTISLSNQVTLENGQRTSTLTRQQLEEVRTLPTLINGSVTMGDSKLEFKFKNFEEIRGFICFTRGTMIRTPQGDVAIEDLRKGDLVTTRGGEAIAIRWIGSRALDCIDLAANAGLRPVRISAGALGDGLPTHDLTVSPQHRVLVSSAIAERMVGTREVLVAAKQLVGAPGIAIVEDAESVEYFHFLLDTHRVIWSNGALSESLYTGLEALKSISAGGRQEIFEIFPELEGISEELEPAWEPAAFLMPGRLARSMLDRHIKNAKPFSSVLTGSENTI